MNDIEATFAEYFSNWDIRLPTDATADRQPGKIWKSGWSIRYVFGEDYLDFYAVHRMTNPRHHRIHSDGRLEWLEAPRDMYGYPGDADESTKQQAKEEFYAYNRRVYAELEAKGLVD
ncbi:MAG: hypothetical protein OXG46_05730 [Chloroflexi bacterium]|nr:hypothetical protein [Chloroflexota bacterium]